MHTCRIWRFFIMYAFAFTAPLRSTRKHNQLVSQCHHDNLIISVTVINKCKQNFISRKNTCYDNTLIRSTDVP